MSLAIEAALGSCEARFFYYVCEGHSFWVLDSSQCSPDTSPPSEGVSGFTVAHCMKEDRNILVGGSRLSLCQSNVSSEPLQDLSVEVQVLLIDKSLLHLLMYLFINIHICVKSQ